MWYITLSLFLLISVRVFVTCDDEYYSDTEKRDSQKYCGPNLPNALHLICGGVYNPIFKKSDPDLEKEWVKETEVFDPNNDVEYLFKPRSLAQMLIMPKGSFRRYTRGAYDECCRKSCSINEMKGYCGDRP